MDFPEKWVISKNDHFHFNKPLFIKEAEICIFLSSNVTVKNIYVATNWQHSYCIRGSWLHRNKTHQWNQNIADLSLFLYKTAYTFIITTLDCCHFGLCWVACEQLLGCFLPFSPFFFPVVFFHYLAIMTSILFISFLGSIPSNIGWMLAVLQALHKANFTSSHFVPIIFTFRQRLSSSSSDLRTIQYYAACQVAEHQNQPMVK